MQIKPAWWWWSLAVNNFHKLWGAGEMWGRLVTMQIKMKISLEIQLKVKHRHSSYKVVVQQQLQLLNIFPAFGSGQVEG